ncbi:MAG: hypothetical protein GOMPHAMPRED_005576 [Gomphillus americanus]|uniref:Lysozyme n=1 Tax=Gomphillus americanus TaxID=1940652 RepID=A0A8H3IQZ1_9LECA|nr:MAG: hypothetical protein GOMPHAMPRED_005576 [Gomphillus americanus]
MVAYTASVIALLAASAAALPTNLKLAKRCTGPAVNQATLTLTENSEGLVDTAYQDPTGHWTIGYGHLCGAAECTDVQYSQPLSTAAGQALLQGDLGTAQDCITNETGENVVLNANEYGALVDWAFNEGCGNVASSTLISRLNNGEDPQTVIGQELPQWVYSDGQELPGLVTRRKNEVNLANTATSAGALPVGNC